MRLIPGYVLICLLSSARPAVAAPVDQAARPNFILLLVDDLGYGDFGCYGNADIKTPQIDRLAAEGLRFTQFYSNSPICSPSRTAWTTGQYPARWKITSYLADRQRNAARGMANWLDPQVPTVARALQTAGYATGHFGKWHMGGQRDVGDAPLITEYGFETSLTQFYGLGERILPLLDFHNGKPPEKHALGSDTLGRGEITWMDRSVMTGAFTRRAIEFIRKSAGEGRPFYVNLWPDDVHGPLFPPGDSSAIADSQQRYLKVLEAMDSQLAPLFDYLRANPQVG